MIIINRSYLVSNKNYKKINSNLGLIIHDECHTIKNNTTKEFYEFILNKYPKISLIWGSVHTIEYDPYKNIISEYTIYIFIDNIILPPKIIWYKSDKILDDYDFVSFIENK